jgi:CDP-diacylglycerol pyrophosphatase
MILPFIVAAALTLEAMLVTAQAADPDALWKIVHEHCVPNEQQRDDPDPCRIVDLHQGVAHGFVLLKDISGKTQYLVLPTARITGIEDPQLLDSGAANYFADAWAERGYTERAAGHALPRDALSLAVNSPYGRSQNQLHIHIDCLRPDVRDALRRQAATIGDHWAPLGAPLLLGHHYWAMRLLGADLAGADPFKLLAARTHGVMNDETLVVSGADFAGRPGFIVLSDVRNPALGDRASGEELQDHACALARR